MTIKPLSLFSRVNFVALGIVLIGVTMVAGTTSLGALALLPLLAILPIVSGITGLNPAAPLPEMLKGKDVAMFDKNHTEALPH